ncbi:MMPL family transporter [Tautonia plasticadhaerens]|uniref:Membrane protein YdgH n=1 Tax=Tautonia plasticadhaerens TaxID=2527974 RepID=A0A518GVQ8_9BACT|nr:MMPL family transporter [Tautonia plasticadhaerens]QDV32683.1 Putative membrane protein YdgH [Tautonia plasticadhaerens]
MPFDALRWFVSRRPAVVVASWIVALVLVVGLAPNLTELAAEGQASLLPEQSESAIAARMLEAGWPDQWFDSSAVLGVHNPGGIRSEDRAFAISLADRFRAPDRPEVISSVLAADADPEVAARLLSEDGTLLLTFVAVDEAFVSPSSQQAVAWLEARAEELGEAAPAGVSLSWSGSAVIGRDYMENVQETLDRAAVATVFLLFGVLMAVYRSAFLAMVPLVTIGVSLMIARGLLAWASQMGWEMSSLVELFLVVLLFGTGTDFCLLLSWRFGENWNASNPRGAIRSTLGRVAVALVTSAFTTIVGLSLMGFTRFKLFSSTGPSVAFGLVITVAAALSLTPALLLFLARWRPRAFTGLTRPPSGNWDRLGRAILRRAWLAWSLTLLLMLPPALLGLSLTAQNAFIQDTVSEMSPSTPSVRGLSLIAEKFGPGATAPMAVVLEVGPEDPGSDPEGTRPDFRSSVGLATIDDISRLLTHQRSLTEVRSATQPLGSTAPFEPARLSARLGAIDQGFQRLVEGAEELRQGLNDGAARIRGALLIGELAGADVLGQGAVQAPAQGPGTPDGTTRGDPVTSGLRRATAAMLGQFGGVELPAVNPIAPVEGDGPVAQLLRELGRAAEGAGQISEGASRASREIGTIMEDPVGRRALDRLLIDEQTIAENPEIARSFEAYISPDGQKARIDLVQTGRPFSVEALDQVERLRERLGDYLQEYDERDPIRPRALVAGPNAESADIRALTRHDQYQTWILVPLGVFLVLVGMLRAPLACLNLVATMILTYAFALGVTHAVFVWGLGAEGIDWKVPYFLFVLLVAVGVDYNVFLMSRLQEEVKALGLKAGITKAIGQTGGLITSAAAITACSFAAMMFSPLSSLRQLGFSLVVGIITDAALVRPILVPCGQWLLSRGHERRRQKALTRANAPGTPLPQARETILS